MTIKMPVPKCVTGNYQLLLSVRNFNDTAEECRI